MNEVFEILSSKYNINFTDSQQEAVLHVDGPCLVLAVAGAGKTQVLASRLANLILNCGISPKNILAVTFNKAAAIGMESRFKQMFGDVIKEEVHFSTIHSLSFQIVREYYRTIGKKYTIIEGDETKINKANILRSIYSSINGAYLNDDKMEELVNNLSYVKCIMMTEDKIEALENGIDNFYEIYLEYERIKNENSYIDFTDMLTISFEILSTKKQILEKYQNKYQYIMVDEAQDTSQIQYAIIKLLISKTNNLFVVGDDDQTLYEFCGVNIKEILEFKQTYPNAKILFMEENFRSTKNIIHVANELIKGNNERYKKELYTRNNTGEDIKIEKVKDEAAQIKYLINQIKAGAKYSDYAILYRNNISSIILVDAFNRNNIPFYLREFKQSFFNHWVIQDIIAFMNLALNRKDTSAFKKIYFKMNSYLPKAAVDYILSQEINTSVFKELLGFDKLNVMQRKRILELEQNFSMMKGYSPVMAINHIENVLSYKKYIEDNADRLGYSSKNLLHYLEILKTIARNTKSIKEFLDRINELKIIMDEAKWNRGKNAVTLSTIHSAKGLEYETVFVIDLVEEQFPSYNAIEAFENKDFSLMEAERRIAYVAFTRARHNLILVTMEECQGEKVQPSRFVQETMQILHPEMQNDIKGSAYRLNAKVYHEVFGKGRVIKLDNEFITISFDKNGVKMLSIELCKTRNLLSAA